MPPRPLLILSDDPTGNSGLGRICRELATRIYRDMADNFIVATFSPGSKPPVLPATFNNLPFNNWYDHHLRNGRALFGLPQIWRSFVGSHQHAAILCIGNVEWFDWLVMPELLPTSILRDFLLGHEGSGIEKWIYIPVDGHCANLQLPPSSARVLRRFDRVLAYNQYGSSIIEATFAAAGIAGISGRGGIPHLPHGIDTSVWYPRDYIEARGSFLGRTVGSEMAEVRVASTSLLIGIVATNTARKDWHLAMEVVGDLIRRGYDVRLWLHIATAMGYWSLPDLAAIHNVDESRIVITQQLGDDDMAWCYSACDVTLGIGSGEGWGYPLVESLACGTPVVHGAYGGGADIVPQLMQIAPYAYRGDGPGSILRPVFSTGEWVNTVLALRGFRSTLPSGLDWNQCWPKWKQWLQGDAK